MVVNGLQHVISNLPMLLNEEATSGLLPGIVSGSGPAKFVPPALENFPENGLRLDSRLIRRVIKKVFLY
jgi:hypothetical protein